MSNENDFAGKLPPALVKALDDQFDYALGLRNGQVIRFSIARLSGKWVHIVGEEGDTHEGGARGGIEMSDSDFHFPRGLDIRLSDIMWVADAPLGS